MAAEGQGDAARALVQHEIDTASAGSPRYVDALYWRAVVAATAADAEKDLRRIIIEFPLSPRNEDALLRLAQLEMTRGENDQALSHLQRLVIDHPTSPSRARASFWMARVYFDKNQTPAACRSLADAAHNTSPGQVEQHNQIGFWMQRCHGMDTAAVASTTVASVAEGTPGERVWEWKMATRSSPASSNCLAKLWRSEWGLKAASLARAAYLLMSFSTAWAAGRRCIVSYARCRRMSSVDVARAFGRQTSCSSVRSAMVSSSWRCSTSRMAAKSPLA